MTNRPKNIGTSAETAVVRAARPLGFPLAERLALAGSADVGDVRLAPWVHLEVKGGKAAETASDAQIEAWMLETERELAHAGALAGALVTKRKGVGATNAHRWWAYVRASWLATWRAYPAELAAQAGPDATVRMTYDSLLAQLRACGYGDPLGAENCDSDGSGVTVPAGTVTREAVAR